MAELSNSLEAIRRLSAINIPREEDFLSSAELYTTTRNTMIAIRDLINDSSQDMIVLRGDDDPPWDASNKPMGGGKTQRETKMILSQIVGTTQEISTEPTMEDWDSLRSCVNRFSKVIEPWIKTEGVNNNTEIKQAFDNIRAIADFLQKNAYVDAALPMLGTALSAEQKRILPHVVEFVGNAMTFILDGKAAIEEITRTNKQNIGNEEVLDDNQKAAMVNTYVRYSFAENPSASKEDPQLDLITKLTTKSDAAKLLDTSLAEALSPALAAFQALSKEKDIKSAMQSITTAGDLIKLCNLAESLYVGLHTSLSVLEGIDPDCDLNHKLTRLINTEHRNLKSNGIDLRLVDEI